MTTPLIDNTPNQAIRFAMEEAGYLQTGNDPSSEDYVRYMPRLNSLVNLFQTQGLKLWLNTDLPVPLLANIALYTLGPSGSVVMVKPLRVIQGYYLDVSGNRRPLIPISRDDYTRLSNVVTTGAINSYFVDKQQLSLNVYFWNTPDAEAATGTCHLIIQQQVTQLLQLNDTVNFPIEWFSALYWGLANVISTGQPQSICDRCSQFAGTYLDALQNWDVEDASTTFSPDVRTGSPWSFR